MTQIVRHIYDDPVTNTDDRNAEICKLYRMFTNYTQRT